jgi:hypothetical protein
MHRRDPIVTNRRCRTPRDSHVHRPLRWTIDTAVSDADSVIFELAQNWAYR